MGTPLKSFLARKTLPLPISRDKEWLRQECTLAQQTQQSKKCPFLSGLSTQAAALCCSNHPMMRSKASKDLACSLEPTETIRMGQCKDSPCPALSCLWKPQCMFCSNAFPSHSCLLPRDHSGVFPRYPYAASQASSIQDP